MDLQHKNVHFYSGGKKILIALISTHALRNLLRVAKTNGAAIRDRREGAHLMSLYTLRVSG